MWCCHSSGVFDMFPKCSRNVSYWTWRTCSPRPTLEDLGPVHQREAIDRRRLQGGRILIIQRLAGPDELALLGGTPADQCVDGRLLVRANEHPQERARDDE